MTDKLNDGDIERGAAEEASGVPVTPTEFEASKTPPSQPSDDGPDIPASEPTD